jgi:hypothetical protein
MPVQNTYTIAFSATQRFGYVDVPVGSAKPLQILGMSVRATNAATNVAIGDIATVLQGNGISIVPGQGDKPEVDLAPRSTFRIMSSRTTSSAVPVRVYVTVTVQERA